MKQKIMYVFKRHSYLFLMIFLVTILGSVIAANQIVETMTIISKYLRMFYLKTALKIGIINSSIFELIIFLLFLAREINKK